MLTDLDDCPQGMSSHEACSRCHLVLAWEWLTPVKGAGERTAILCPSCHINHQLAYRMTARPVKVQV